MLTMYVGRDKFDVSDQIRREQKAWSSLVELLGLRWNEHFFPSERALQAKTKAARLGIAADLSDVPDAMYIRTEYSCTTYMLLLIFVSWLRKRRPESLRLRARSIFASLLCRCFETADWEALSMEALADEHSHLCKERINDAIYCFQLRAFHITLRTQCATEHANSALDNTDALLPFLEQCDAAKKLVEGILCFFAGVVEEKVTSLGVSDASKWSHCMGQAKRRRMDQDFKNWVTVENVHGQAAPSAAASAASHAVHLSTTRRWIERSVTQHVLDCWQSLGKSVDGVWSLVEDGARFGQPARETQVYALWAANRGYGAWTLPQVFPQ